MYGLSRATCQSCGQSYSIDRADPHRVYSCLYCGARLSLSLPPSSSSFSSRRSVSLYRRRVRVFLLEEERIVMHQSESRNDWEEEDVSDEPTCDRCFGWNPAKHGR